MNENTDSNANKELAAPPKTGKKIDIPVKLILSAAVFGVSFSYLFTKQTMGLNMFVFVLLVYAFAVFNRKLFIKKTFNEEPWMYLFTAPVLFLAAYIFIGSTTLNGLSVLVILFVMFAQFLVLSKSALHEWDSPAFLTDMILGFINRIILGLGCFSAGAINKTFKKQSSKKKGIVIGISFGLLLLIIIVPMLMLADANVSRILSDAFRNIYLGDIILYVFVFLAGASVITAPIARANKKREVGKSELLQGEKKRPAEGVTAGIALSMISVVYILFAIVQFTYFFAPQETIASVLGLTSSAYAVRGFSELLFITCLNFLIIALAMRFTKCKNGKTQNYLKVLYTVLIAFNFVIMASSHIRMQCYEAAYGYTVARFLSHSFMAFLAVLNTLTLIRVYNRIKIGKLALAAALIYFCTIVAINPELYVVKKNIQRYEQTGKIDTSYLFLHWGDALSEACDFAAENPNEFDDNAQGRAQTNLEWNRRQNNNWQSFDIADKNAYEKLRRLLE